MAQEVKIAGALFSDVPSIQVPDSNDVYHTFVDSSDATATASDIASGKTAYVDGVKVTGTANQTASKKAVNFYDYDGTILYSYTASEASALTALPNNPTHDGLTAQGWNYTLAQMQSEVTAQGRCDIGQMYVTDDGKTRVYVTMSEGRLSPYLGVAVNGTVTVDWDDGSTSTLTGSSTSTLVETQHTYASAGDYVIKLTVDGSMALIGSSRTTYLMYSGDDSSSNINRAYQSSIYKIELGTNVDFGNYAFCYCHNLETITMPSTITAITYYEFYTCQSLGFVACPTGITSISVGAFHTCLSMRTAVLPYGTTTINNNAFYNCPAFEGLRIPSTVTTIGNYVFQGANALSSGNIPDTVTSLGISAFRNCSSLVGINLSNQITAINNTAFYGCAALASVNIESSVTSIGTQAFYGCYGLGEIHFKGTTPPTVADSNAWTNVPTDCKIYVPSGYLSAYTSASNYPDSSTYTYIEE